MSSARTVQLGQFVDENAEAIVERLIAADITHHVKRPTGLVRLLSAADWGTRIFVAQDRLEEARRLAAEVTDG